MTLEGDIRINRSTGYDIWLRTARIDFTTGGLVSEEPVRVVLDGGDDRGEAVGRERQWPQSLVRRRGDLDDRRRGEGASKAAGALMESGK